MSLPDPGYRPEMRGGGRGGNGGRGGRDKVKPKRGGPRHFTVHPRDIYERESRPNHDESGSDSGCDDEQLARQVGVLSIGCDDNEEEVSSSEEEEEEEPVQPKSRPANPNARQAPTSISISSRPPTLEELQKKPAHELTRREREAIEKERARQHFLKMKEKEDAARLAVVRKQREEAAAKAAAEKLAKEEARRRK